MSKYISSDIYFAILMILSIILLMYVIGLIRNLSLLNRKKRNVNEAYNVSEQEKLDYSIGVINLINNIIDIEVNGFLKSNVVLGNPYNIINLDKDVETISTSVFNAIKSDVYVNNTILLSDTYILTYITRNVSYVLIVRALTLNNKVRESD